MSDEKPEPAPKFKVIELDPADFWKAMFGVERPTDREMLDAVLVDFLIARGDMDAAGCN
jgi:hypothetical protein